jgi:hypothetical protein
MVEKKMSGNKARMRFTVNPQDYDFPTKVRHLGRGYSTPGGGRPCLALLNNLKAFFTGGFARSFHLTSNFNRDRKSLIRQCQKLAQNK